VFSSSWFSYLRLLPSFCLDVRYSHVHISLRLRLSAHPAGDIPFNISNYPGVIRATARQLPGWGASHNAADEPPTSPIDCSSVKGGCGAATAVTLVPYGMTDLRMAALPWISKSV
jgi:hypothetical protein